MKIVVLDGYTLNPGDLSWDKLEALGEVTIYERTPADLITTRLEGAELVFTNKTPITRQTLKLCTDIKYIGVLATGYNVVDTVAAAEKNIPVTNVASYGTNAVSQYTIALLLELCHHIGAHSDSVKHGDWTSNKDFCYWNYPLVELAGKTMGIIGFGRIGQETAKIAQAFGMKILVSSPLKQQELETETLQYVSFEELLEKSDVISLHCPLNPDTQGIINKETITKMKDGVLIINDSRGPLIVEEDLRDALNSGKVAGAAVDVAIIEPISVTSPLLEAKNIIITPHIAWAPKEARERLMNIAVDNLEAYLAGKAKNVVN